MRQPLPGHLLFLALAANMAWTEVLAQEQSPVVDDGAALKQITIYRCGDPAQTLQDRPCVKPGPSASASLSYDQPSDASRRDAQSRTKAQAELADKLEADRLRREAAQGSAAQQPVIINPMSPQPDVIVLRAPKRRPDRPAQLPRYVGPPASAPSKAPPPKRGRP
ncbi:MAG: hypothetical protein JO370_04665 [Paucibacter sp.]|nr:hypothetical protein [Roseateles sp.]